MTYRERRRLAVQLNLDPDIWTMVHEGTSYITYRNTVTGEIAKRYYGGECR